MAMGSATTPPGAEEDDWEVVNDEGFVYKRKRLRLESVAGASIPPLPTAEPQKERRRRELKRTVLSKLGRKYSRELDRWECLWKTVKEMEEESRERERDCDRTESCSGSISGAEKEMEGACGFVVDDLLRQEIEVEGQEAMIHDFSNLCDVAEATCNTEDERIKQYLIDLPIWASSPGELIAILCDSFV